MRGEDEWVTTEQPHLAIVTKDLWDRVQARFAERKGAKGRARGTGGNGHLLTGLLRCGECGSTMRVVSVKWKAGRAYANFGCSAHHGKGAAICGNGLVISERKLPSGRALAGLGFSNPPRRESCLSPSARAAAAARLTVSRRTGVGLGRRTCAAASTPLVKRRRASGSSKRAAGRQRLGT